MSVSPSLDAPAATHAHREHHWPRRLGLAGMAVGAIMTFNALQNLAHQLTWTDQQWRALLESLGTELVSESLPSRPVMIGSALIEILLGAVLLVGSWWLFWRTHRAIRICKAWAWATIAYVGITGVWIVVWMAGFLASFGGVPEDARGAAYAGFVVTLLVLAAFPLFMLYWLSRDDVQREYAAW